MDMESIRDLVIPLASIVSLPIVFCVAFYYRYRTRKDLQETLRRAIEQGTELTPETLERLGGPAPGKDLDLRRGVIASAAGIGLVIFSFVFVDADAEGMRGLRATGALVLVVGLAFIGLWRFSDGRER